MHKLKDTTSVEGDYADTSLPIFTNEKGPYKLDRDAHVVGLTYMLKPLQDATNGLYIYLIFVRVCNE
jgi:hypothetical protein